jgi:putative transposase
VLVGEDAKGPSATALGRLKASWAEAYQGWTRRRLGGKEYAYWWVDGIDTTLLERDDPKRCLLVIIGVTADGTKEWVAISDGLRESTESWLDVLRDRKARGLQAGPRLAVGDGALGFWGRSIRSIPRPSISGAGFTSWATCSMPCPSRCKARRRRICRRVFLAPIRKQADQAFKRFISRYAAKYPKATEKLEKDRAALLACFAFPAEHWVHRRTTNPIESTFATVRHRTGRTKHGVTRATFLGLPSNWPRKRRRRGDASVLPRRSPSSSAGHATKTEVRCRTTHRRPKRSNGRPPEKRSVPWSYTRFDNNSSAPWRG